MRADTLTQVPNADYPSAITADQLALVGMDDDVVDCSFVRVVALEATSTSVPHLDGAVLGASDHPLALTVKRDTSDVGGVTLEGHDRVGVGGLDIVELDIVVACGRKEALVGGNAQAIDLRIRVLDGARTDPREGLPEAGNCN